MGLIMSTGEVKSQLSTMNSNLDQIISQAQLFQGRIAAFEDTGGQLKGESYNSMRNYYSSTHLPTVRGLICYMEDLKSANDQYSSLIDTYLSGVGYVDEDGLGNSLDITLRLRAQVASIEKLTPIWRSYDMALAGMQRSLEDKLDKIAQFVSAASGIYNGVESSKAQVQAGINCMQSVSFNTGNCTFNMQGINLAWADQLNEKWGRRIDTEAISQAVLEQLGDEVLTYEEYVNLPESQQYDYLDKVAQILLKLIPNTNLSVGDKIEVAIGPDMTAYYEIKGEIDTNPESALEVGVVIEEQKVILESFSAFLGNAEAVLGVDGKLGYKIEEEIYQDTFASKGIYTNYFDRSVSVEYEVTTTIDNASVTSTVGVKKSVNINSGWETVPVPKTVPVIVPEEKEWWEEAWDGICGVGETVSNTIGDGIDWLCEHKEELVVAGTVIYIGGKLVLAIPTGGLSLALP